MSDAVMQRMLAVLTPDMIDKFRSAIELGKWPDGKRLTREQTETCMPAIIGWEMKNLPEHARSGCIPKESKEGEVCDNPQEQPKNVQFIH